MLAIRLLAESVCGMKNSTQKYRFYFIKQINVILSIILKIFLKSNALRKKLTLKP